MQHIDGVLEFGQVEDAIFTLRVDSNLNDSAADKWNRPPICGRTSCLHKAQLIADFATRGLWEPSQPVTTVSEPLDRFCIVPHSLRLYRISIIGTECDRLAYLVARWFAHTIASNGSPTTRQSGTSPKRTSRGACRNGGPFSEWRTIRSEPTDASPMPSGGSHADRWTIGLSPGIGFRPPLPFSEVA